jgi:hypothetical protein
MLLKQMISTAYRSISFFIRIGSQSTENEKAKALAYAQKFIEEAHDGRDIDTSIIRVGAGQEPSMFTAQFPSWDPELSKSNKFVDPYQAKLEKLAAEKAANEGY